MKVTTQQTSKPIKLITALGVLLMLSSPVIAYSGAKWADAWLGVLLLGAALWAVGRVLKWFFHE